MHFSCRVRPARSKQCLLAVEFCEMNTQISQKSFCKDQWCLVVTVVQTVVRALFYSVSMHIRCKSSRKCCSHIDNIAGAKISAQWQRKREQCWKEYLTVKASETWADLILLKLKWKEVECKCVFFKWYYINFVLLYVV